MASGLNYSEGASSHPGEGLWARDDLLACCLHRKKVGLDVACVACAGQ